MPPALFLFLTLILALLSHGSYARSTPLASRWHIGLPLLRFLLLFTLLLLFSGLWVAVERPEEESSPVQLFLDRSESLQVDRPQWNGRVEMEDVVSRLERELDKRGIPLEHHAFASTVDPLRVDSLWSSSTQFDPLLRTITNQFSRSPAAIILSDGMDTHATASSSRHMSESMPPLYTYSIGDPATLADIVLEEVQVMNPLPLNQTHQLLIKVQRFNMTLDRIPIEVTVGEQEIDVEPIEFATEDSVGIATVPFRVQETGSITIHVRIPDDAREWSAMNNVWTGNRSIVDHRLVVWHIASSIHPDVRWVREEIRSNPRFRLQTSDHFLVPDRFPEPDPDVVILQGGPVSNVWPDTVMEKLSSSGILWFATSDGIAWPNRGESNEIPVPGWSLDSPRSPTTRSLSGISAEDRDHPLLNPLQHGFRLSETPLWIYHSEWIPEATIQTITFDGEHPLPFLHLQEVGNRRRLLVRAEGWHRFPHSSEPQERQLASELLSSMIQWVGPDQRQDPEQHPDSTHSEPDRPSGRQEIHPTGRNDSFLQNLANETDGYWTTTHSGAPSSEWLDHLERTVRQDSVREQTVMVTLTPAWFLWLVLLAAAEWSLRRRFRMQ